MSLFPAINPFAVILNQDGGGLNGGRVYIGQPNQDPQTFPKEAYWDADATDLASQPLATIGGYIWNAGTPAQFYVDGTYSIRILDRFNRPVLYEPEVTSPLDAFITDIAANGGAGLVGASQAIAYAAGTLGAKYNQTFNPMDAPWLAVGDGTANDRTALASADAAAVTAGKPLYITGNHRIGSNLTLQSTLIFAGGRITIADGAALTFARIQAPLTQIFNIPGTGTVAGLRDAQGEWFMGDIMTPFATTPIVDCRALLDKAVASVATGGWFRMGPGRLKVNGATLTFVGDINFDAATTQFEWQDGITNGLSFQPASNGRIANVGTWTWLVPGTYPTAGTAVEVNRAECTFSGKIIRAYRGWDLRAGVSNHLVNVYAYGCIQNGIRTTTIDQFVTYAAVQAQQDIVQLSGITGGTFNAGDNISITGSVGFIGAAFPDYPGRYEIFFNDAEPTNGLAITDTTTGATATISNILIGHQSGGVRLEGDTPGKLVEACIFDNMESLGGLYHLTVGGSGSVGARAGNPSFNRIRDGFYGDSSYRGALIDKALGWTIGGWHSNARAKNAIGITLTNCRKIMISAQMVANSGPGVFWDDSNIHIELNGYNLDGNCRNHTSPAYMAEISILGAAEHWKVIGGWAGFTGQVNGVTPPKAIFVGTNVGGNVAAQYWKLIGVDAPDNSISLNLSVTNTTQRIVASSNLTDR